MKLQKTSLTLFLFATMLVSPNVSYPCSLVHTPTSKFNHAEYIFAGQVVGYVGPLTAPHVRGEAWGVIVKPRALVSVPRKSAGDYEVYPLQLEPDCNTSGSTREWLSQQYPEGATVKVAAMEMKTTDGRPHGGNVRLSVSPHNNGLMARNEEDVDARTLAGRLYNYGGYKEGAGPRRNIAFEVRKDLWRLERARGDGDKEEVLRRLLHCPRYGVDYAELVRQHISNKRRAAILIDERRKWEAIVRD